MSAVFQNETQQPGKLALLNTEGTALAERRDSMFNLEGMQAMQKMAELMATATVTIPKHLVNKPGDCLAVVMQAAQWEMNPYAVAQKTHLTQGGQLGYEAQLINAVVITCAPIKERPKFEFFGDWTKILGMVKEERGQSGGKYYVADWEKAHEAGLGVRCRATFRGETEPREIELLLVQCWPRFSTQWATDPQQQITYASVRKWARRYSPDVILGVYTPEELAEGIPGGERDMGAADVIPAAEVDKAAAVRDKLRGGGTGAAPAAPSGPSLDKVLKMISVATFDDMEDVIKQCAAMKNADDKATARKAYADRMAVLKAEAAKPKTAPQQEPAGAATGSATPGADAIPYAQVADAINAAKNSDQLALAQDLIRNVADAGQQEELRGLASGRAAEFSFSGGN